MFGDMQISTVFGRCSKEPAFVWLWTFIALDAGCKCVYYVSSNVFKMWLFIMNIQWFTSSRTRAFSFDDGRTCRHWKTVWARRYFTANMPSNISTICKVLIFGDAFGSECECLVRCERSRCQRQCDFRNAVVVFELITLHPFEIPAEKPPPHALALCCTINHKTV